MKGTGVNIPLVLNEQIAKKLHKPIIKNSIKKNSLFRIWR